jgi:NAD(P) transhydrogenase
MTAWGMEAEVPAISQYDLVVIGSGPAGQKGAIAAAKLGKRVAVIDRPSMIGGVSLHTGTIPSKTAREAALYLSGFRQRAFYGEAYTLKEHVTASDVTFRVEQVVAREGEVVQAEFQRNGIEIIPGLARFLDPHTVAIVAGGERVGEEGAGAGPGTPPRDPLAPDADPLRVRGDHILIACGTRPAHDPRIPVDGRRVYDTDTMEQLEGIPDRLIVVGAGVIGLEYACMAAALGRDVTVIDHRTTLLDFVDREIVERLLVALRRNGVTFRLGETVVSVERDASNPVVILLESGKKVQGDALLYAVGRQANTDQLDLEAAGLTADARGRIAVNAQFQTTVPHIYAAGDVIGFPALAATSMEQGRLAARSMFGVPVPSAPPLLPYGIYTIPEISMVGQTEEQLTDARVPYEVGVASYEEVARGQIVGDVTGLLKLLFDPRSLRLLGVHAIGESATEIIHIGQAVLALGGTVEYFRDAVFNYPALAEAYKVAALNGLNKL